MKWCNKCKEWKEESEFHKCESKKDELTSNCKECCKQRSRKHHWDHRERNNQLAREWCKNNSKKRSQHGKKQRRSPLKYNTQSKYKKELKLYEEIRESKNGNIEVKCTYCGDWFEPTRQEIQNRAKAVNDELRGEHKLYCSNNCKESCSIFHKKWYERGYEPATSREVQPVLRKMVFARDNYTCQDCNTHRDDLEIGIECHHNEGVQWNPIESADVDKCKTLCKNCHDEFHSQPGYRYKDYQCPPHLKYNM